MDAAFGWIGDFLQWLVSWVPRLDLCRATHGGVKFACGKHVREIKPGLFFYWPAVTECVLLPVVRHPVDLPAQSLTTKDGKTVLVSVTLVVEIQDVVKALGKTWDVDDMIVDVGRGAAVEIVAGRKWCELKAELADGGLCDELVKGARALLRPYGVRVIKGRFTDFARHIVIRNIGEAAIPIPEQPEEE